MHKKETNIYLDKKCLHGFKNIPDACSLEVIGSRLNKIGEGILSPMGNVRENPAIQFVVKK